MGLFGSFFKSQIDKDLEMMESGCLDCPPPYLPESEIEADIMFDRFPEKFICEGPVAGKTEFCVDNGHIYEGFMPGGKCVATVSEDGHIYEGFFPWGKCIGNIGSDNRIYEGYFPGKVMGSIINDRITLDGNYFPTQAADYNIV
jgi:hypothetical protein